MFRRVTLTTATDGRARLGLAPPRVRVFSLCVQRLSQRDGQWRRAERERERQTHIQTHTHTQRRLSTCFAGLWLSRARPGTAVVVFHLGPQPSLGPNSGQVSWPLLSVLVRQHVAFGERYKGARARGARAPSIVPNASRAVIGVDRPLLARPGRALASVHQGSGSKAHVQVRSVAVALQEGEERDDATHIVEIRRTMAGAPSRWAAQRLRPRNVLLRRRACGLAWHGGCLARSREEALKTAMRSSTA